MQPWEIAADVKKKWELHQMNQGVRLPGDEGVVERAGNETAAAVNNAFTDIADWWEDVRPGWIIPKRQPLKPPENSGGPSQPQESMVSASAAEQLPGLSGASRLQMPSSMRAPPPSR